ncbi:MAG: LamG domain-containing protein, partial [Phycisphaerales bacterium]
FYWRVDEYNTDGTISSGRIWSFTVGDYGLVDDFESYNDIPEGEEGSNLVYVRYQDGFDNPNVNGSTIGYVAGESMEKANVHGGSQSVPFIYNNTMAAVSEVTLNITPAQDWTAQGIITLSLWFAGDGANVPGQFYVKINGVQVNYDGEMSNLTLDSWQVWNIDLTTVGTNMSTVTSFAFGVQGSAASGTLLLDDIRLYALPRELITPIQPDPAGLVAHFAFDGNANDSSGNNNHGTVMGDAQWVAGGKLGGALAFDGLDDIVVVTQNSGLPIYNNGTDNAYSVAMWVKGGPQNDMRVFSEGSTTNNNPLFNLGTQNAGATGQFDVYIRPVGMGHTYSVAEPFDDTWHHIVWVDENGAARLYIDGRLDGGDFNYTRATLTLDTTTIGGILRAAPSHFFTGQIDDVHIYNRALSHAEIAGLAGRIQPFDAPLGE